LTCARAPLDVDKRRQQEIRSFGRDPAGRAHRDLPCWVSRFPEPKLAGWELQRMWRPKTNFPS
jgi:hypothetical protein